MNQEIKVLGVIPARYQSSRFPGKPLVELKGKSMIQRVYEGALKSKLLTELIVATDDQRIFDHVISFGGKAEMTSNSHTSGTDRCGEVLDRNKGYDVVINIQGDEPLVSAEQIDELIDVFRDPKVKIGTLGIKDVSEQDQNNPNRIKLVTDVNNDAIYFSRSPIPSTAHACEIAKVTFSFRRHIGLYAFRSEVLKEVVLLQKTLLEQTESLEQLRWMYYGYKIRVVDTNIETPNIDVPEDVEKVLPYL
jgi:3-deoxy-manno-octulosonate cytidylyltransferase (CMP-KDO synthetase)